MAAQLPAIGIFEILLVPQPDRILHEHDVDFAEVLCLNREDSEYFGKQRIRVLFEVLGVPRRHLFHEV